MTRGDRTLDGDQTGVVACEAGRKTLERDWRKSSCEKDVCGASRPYDKTAEYTTKPGSMRHEDE